MKLIKLNLILEDAQGLIKYLEGKGGIDKQEFFTDDNKPDIDAARQYTEKMKIIAKGTPIEITQNYHRVIIKLPKTETPEVQKPILKEKMPLKLLIANEEGNVSDEIMIQIDVQQIKLDEIRPEIERALKNINGITIE